MDKTKGYAGQEVPLMAEILVDTSVWVEYFNRPQSLERLVVDDLIHGRRLTTAGMVIAEVLQGIHEGNLRNEVQSLFETMPYLEMTKPTWAKTADLGRNLRRAGTPLPLTDMMLAALAIEHGLLLYSLDGHFDRISKLGRFRPPQS